MLSYVLTAVSELVCWDDTTADEWKLAIMWKQFEQRIVCLSAHILRCSQQAVKSAHSNSGMSQRQHCA